MSCVLRIGGGAEKAKYGLSVLLLSIRTVKNDLSVHKEIDGNKIRSLDDRFFEKLSMKGDFFWGVGVGAFWFYQAWNVNSTY